jgi:monooxygenase
MREPAKAKQKLIALVRRQLGPDYDVATHFTPRYNPWDQRLCLVPDADLFAALRAGTASVVTDHDRDLHRDRHPPGLRPDLEADLVVTATGLVMRLVGGLAVEVDGTTVRAGRGR